MNPDFRRMVPIFGAFRKSYPVGEHLTGQRGQPKRTIKFAIGQQSSIGGDDHRLPMFMGLSALECL